MSEPSPVFYVRFVCFRLVKGQRQRLGLFQALEAARDSDFAPSWALHQIREINEWFDDNLALPDQFLRGGWKANGRYTAAMGGKRTGSAVVNALRPRHISGGMLLAPKSIEAAFKLTAPVGLRSARRNL